MMNVEIDGVSFVTTTIQRRLVKWSIYLSVTSVLIALAGFIKPSFDIQFIISTLLIASSVLLISNRKKSGKIFVYTWLVASTVFISNLFLFFKSYSGFALSSLNQQAACFIFISVALLCSNYQKASGLQAFAFLGGLISLFSVICFIYRVQPHSQSFVFVHMKASHAMVFLLISLGMLLSIPDKGIAGEFSSSFTGGTMARTLIPLAVLFPIGLGFLRLFGHWYGIFSVEFDVAVLVMCIIIVFLAMILYNTVLLNRKDKLRTITEAELRAGEERFRLMVTSIKDYAIFMIDPQGIVISWNKGAQHIKGYRADEIIGRHISVFYTAEEMAAKEPEENLEMAKKYGQYEREGWRKRKNGSEFWANIVFTAIYDHTGKLQGFAKITRDITERKKSHEELEVLSRQINQSNDAIYTVDENLVIKSWNTGARNLYEFSADEVLGKASNLILGTTLKPLEIDALLTDIAKNDYWSGELHRKTKSGNEIIVRSSTTTIRDSNGKIKGYVAVSFDITRQKLLEKELTHLANIVEQSSEAIFSRGLNQRFLSWNSGAEKLFGYSKSEILGKTVQETGIVSLTKDEVNQIEQHIIENGMWKSEMTYYNKNGDLFFGAVTANLIRNEKGEISSFNFIIKDISLRKQLEEQLKLSNEELEKRVAERTIEIYKNEQRFRAMVENNNDIVSMMDASMSVVYRSPSAMRMTGWTIDEIRLKGSQIIHPEDITALTAAMQQARAHPGLLIQVAFRTLHKNGHYLFVEGSVINLLDDENVQAIVTNFRDITEQRKAEEKLAANERRFRAIIENNYDSIVLMDQTLKVIYRSPASSRLTGWTDEEMNRPEAAKNVHPDDTERLTMAIKEVVIHPEIPVNIRYRFRHKKGYYIWVEANIINRLQDESVKAIVFNSRDVTERIIAEEQLSSSEKHFRALIENNYDVITLMDESFKLIYRSPSASRVTGWTNEDMLTIDATVHIHPDDIAAQREKVKEVMGNPGKRFDILFRMLHKKGHIIWIEGIMTNRLKDENVKAVVFNYRDITHRKEAEETLNRSYQEIRQLASHLQDIREEERAGIAREIHDELGQKLTSLKMDMSWIREKLAPKEDKLAWGKIKETILLLDNTIDTVRKIATQLRPGILDDLGLIAAIDWLSHDFMKRSEIDTVFKTNLDDEEFDAAVSIGLFRICQESLTNVARYSAAKQVMIELKQTGEQLVLSVCDNGKGFDVNNTGAKKTLGLLGMKERALMMEGTLSIVSIPAGGTTVIAQIPLHTFIKK